MNIIPITLIGDPRGATTPLNRFPALKDLNKAPLGRNTPPKVYLVVLTVDAMFRSVRLPLHSVPESLYSFRLRFSRISVFYNRKFKKNCEIAEFIPNQLRFHEKNFS